MNGIECVFQVCQVNTRALILSVLVDLCENLKVRPLFLCCMHASGGSRGFLLVLKNYPFSDLKNNLLLSSS